MIHIREVVEDLCQNLDLYQITPAGDALDKLTFEEFVKAEGKGPSALASATVWTRAMLGEVEIFQQRGFVNEHRSRTAGNERFVFSGLL